MVWNALRDVPLRVARLIADTDETDWDIALTVANHLANNSTANLMVRQLAIPGVNSKWLEQHADLVMALICPPDEPRIGGSALTQLQHHVGLRAKESKINVALRCQRLRSSAAGLSHFSAAIKVLNAGTLRPRIVLVTENDELGHTFGIDIDGLIVIHGLGKAVVMLAQLDWLSQADRVLYWGDIDRAGLQCLAALRCAGISATSILMDLDTLNKHQRFVHTVDSQDDSHAVPDGFAPHETALYEYLNAHHQDTGRDLQLEQEHVPIAEAEATVRELQGSTCQAFEERTVR